MAKKVLTELVWIDKFNDYFYDFLGDGMTESEAEVAAGAQMRKRYVMIA